MLEAFALGLLTAGSPCLLPLYPGFVAYMAANSSALEGHRAAGLIGAIVLAGILTTMIGFGLLVTALSIASGRLLIVIVPVADGVVVVIGALLVVGRNPFAKREQRTQKWREVATGTSGGHDQESFHGAYSSCELAGAHRAFARFSRRSSADCKLGS